MDRVYSLKENCIGQRHGPMTNAFRARHSVCIYATLVSYDMNTITSFLLGFLWSGTGGYCESVCEFGLQL